MESTIGSDNIFIDLGFEHKEAANLLAMSNRHIEAKKRRMEANERSKQD